ncbi:hypothetical protein N0V94_007143 [Neodidymelliopsis sp. IMI 364377]|nr:hypothetical protein N0V94_007143 [Neodidymelliopsis sp. IMI 364377]
MKRGPSKGYIKELADRLNSLESQIQHPQTHQYDLQNIPEPNFADIQSPPQFHRKRTHSMSEGFQDAFGRSSWSGQDRGNENPLEQTMLSLLTTQETPLNGDRRTSFGEMTLAGNLITGSNEATLKAVSQLLGQIAGCITEAGFNDSRVLNLVKEQDHESFQNSRRVFWTAFILDRFYASSRSKDIMLPLYSGSLTRDDYSALGEVGYHLARAATIVGQVAFVNRAGSVPSIEPSSPFAFLPLTATSPQSIYLNGQLTTYRESIDITELTNNSPPHLALQYLRVFVGRLSSQSLPSTEVLSLTKELLHNLVNGSITPLHHVFASLVVTSLTELSDRVETQVEAHAAIKEMSDALNNGQIIHRGMDHTGWDVAVRETLHQKLSPTPPGNTASLQTSSASEPNMAGLQHLAAAAVGEREGTDVRPVSSSGNGNHDATLANAEHDLSAAMAAANDAAMAQATAAAAQQQLTVSSPDAKSGNNFDTSGLSKDDFMASLS